jgi:hypothetical protein
VRVNTEVVVAAPANHPFLLKPVISAALAIRLFLFIVYRFRVPAAVVA